jgi:exodeoxyribonuclease V gamma subunit
VLHLHRGERADVLASALCGLLSGAADDPFAPEIVCVPSRGVERWLTQQLSLVLGARPGAFDGVCANVEFPGPGRLVAEAVAAVSGIESRTDPWRPGRSVWPLLELIEADPGVLSGSLDAAVGAVTAVGAPSEAAGEGRSRQYAAARHVAELFDAYAMYRPAMISDWATGADSDGAGEVLAADVRWQPELWRRLRSVLEQPSPAERLGPACDQLRADARAVGLPQRLSLFGLTRLPPSQLAVLAALAEQRDVHLWLLHPSPPLWQRLAASGPVRPTRRRSDSTAALARHRLLSSLGRDGRELQLTLGSAVAAQARIIDTHHRLPAANEVAADSVLMSLQRAIRADAPTPHGQRAEIAAGDRSVQIHACHGRARQVDVVRDVILGLLAGDPTLEPRDVVVMCPDIEAFAPLISATFGVGVDVLGAQALGTGDAQPAPPSSPAALLRVRLADRSLRQTNPMMSVAATLLELVDGRMTASEVLDFAAAAPVRRRFAFDDDDLGRLTEWVAEAQVRWGLDAAHRAAFKLEAFGQNTWEAGLDRMLLGVAMADGPAGGDAGAHPAGGGWLGRALPLDDVDSTDIELVGRLAELVERLRNAVDALRGPQSLAAWITTLGVALESLTLTAAAELWQAAQLRSELAAVVDAAGDRADEVTLSLADLRSLLADRLRGRPTRANFRTGSLTMCTLVPMRSVPHRVVCLLGLDDGAFPRQPAVDGDDILRRDPMTGERDERSEDRQLLLDAILAAGEHLVITYTGADERTNSTRPPAVPVGELLDTLEASFRARGGGPVRQRLLTHHPLQPFDPANFTEGALGIPEPFSFDPAALGGARAMVAPRRPAPPFLEQPLPAAPPGDLELETLRSFYEHPARGFLRQRLGVTLPRREEEASDRLPIQLDSLERWQIGQRMLDARLSGLDQAHCRQAEWRRGALPPGRLGGRVLDEVADEVEQVIAEVEGLRAGQPRALDLAAPLAGGRRLTGTVGNVYVTPLATTLVHTSFGQVNHKRRFRAWLALLLLSAAHPAQQFAGVAAGRMSQVAVGPIDAAEAVDWLGDLVAVYDLGLREPLPIASKSSFEYASARRKGAVPDEALKAASTAWEGSRWGGERQEAEHEQVYGPAPAFSALLEALPQLADGADHWPDEPTRFGVLSRRWWDPMLEGESRARG